MTRLLGRLGLALTLLGLATIPTSTPSCIWLTGYCRQAGEPCVVDENCCEALVCELRPMREREPVKRCTWPRTAPRLE